MTNPVSRCICWGSIRNLAVPARLLGTQGVASRSDALSYWIQGIVPLVPRSQNSAAKSEWFYRNLATFAHETSETGIVIVDGLSWYLT